MADAKKSDMIADAYSFQIGIPLIAVVAAAVVILGVIWLILKKR